MVGDDINVAPRREVLPGVYRSLEGARIFTRQEAVQRREGDFRDFHMRKTYPLGRASGGSYDHLNCGDE